MFGQLTVRMRLIVLSGMLLCVVIGTNVFLTSKLTDTSAAIVTATDLNGVIQSANDARIAFGEMRYWLTDLAVSQLTLSETNASAARDRMTRQLDMLATHRPELVTDDAVDQYTNDRRIIGNSLLAQAREHSVKVDTMLATLIADLEAEVTAERDRVVREVAAATRLTLIVVLIAMLGGTVLTVVIVRSIATPLRRLILAIDGLGSGDLAVAIPPPEPNEFGAMARALTLFRDSLKERNQLAAEREQQRKTIAAAIGTISEGFVLYDANDRIVLCNEQFRDIYPTLADILKLGRHKTGSRRGSASMQARAASSSTIITVDGCGSASGGHMMAAPSPSIAISPNSRRETSNWSRRASRRKSRTERKVSSSPI